MKELTICSLPKVRDSWSYLYRGSPPHRSGRQEHRYSGYAGEDSRPLLQPFISASRSGKARIITHAAIRALADNG